MSRKARFMIFAKFARKWLSQVTGFSKGYISRINSDQQPLTRSFIDKCCYKLGEPESELFSKP